MRYLMLDRVTQFTPDATVTALKNVSRESDVLEHHFYGFPVFPGALTLEVMAQAAGYLIIRSEKEARAQDVLAVLSSVDRAHFHRAVFPGDRMEVQVTMDGKTTSTAHLTAVARVESDVVAKARLTLAFQTFDLATRPDVAAYMSRFFDSLERKGGLFDRLS